MWHVGGQFYGAETSRTASHARSDYAKHLMPWRLRSDKVGFEFLGLQFDYRNRE